jgi:hypothetical protein
MNSVVLFVVLCSAVFAAPDLVFYVSSVHGNDSNAGSLLAPLRSLSGVGAAVASSSRAVDVILFAGERFDSCGESLSVAGSLRLHGNGSSVSCAQRNATAGLVLSSSGATLELRDVSFVDFDVFNVSAVSLTGAHDVLLRNVAVSNCRVRAACVVDGGFQSAVLSPLAVSAPNVSLVDSRFANNSLSVAVTRLRLARYDEMLTLPVPGGGAVGLTATVAAAVRNCSFVANEAVASGAQFDNLSGVPGSASLCGGGLLVVTNGGVNVTGSAFLRNTVSASSMCGGGVAVVFDGNETAAFRVADSVFVGNGHVGAGLQSLGANVALRQFQFNPPQPGQCALALSNVTFDGGEPALQTNASQLWGWAAFAHVLTAASVRVVRVNVSAGAVEGGVFSALRMSLSDVCVSDCFFDGVRTADNGVVLGHARAVAANCAALTVQNSVVANVTARGSVDAVIAFIAVLSPCSFAGGVASASSSATLVGVVIADNAVVQVQNSARRRDLVRFDVKADVQLRNTVARNNSAFGALLRSDCRRFVADQFVSSGNAMIDAADFAIGVTSESVTIRSSRIETIGAVGAMAFACVARRTDASAFAVALENATVLSSGSPGVISVACDGGGDSFLIVSSTLVNTLLLTKATFAGSGGFQVKNTTFDRSTLHFVVSPLAQQQWCVAEIHDSLFRNGAPAIAVEDDAFFSTVAGRRHGALRNGTGFLLHVEGVRFVSDSDGGHYDSPIVVCSSAVGRVVFDNVSVSAAGQRGFVMSCPSVRMSAVNASGTSLEVLFATQASADRCRLSPSLLAINNTASCVVSDLARCLSPTRRASG